MAWTISADVSMPVMPAPATAALISQLLLLRIRFLYCQLKVCVPPFPDPLRRFQACQRYSALFRCCLTHDASYGHHKDIIFQRIFQTCAVFQSQLLALLSMPITLPCMKRVPSGMTCSRNGNPLFTHCRTEQQHFPHMGGTHISIRIRRSFLPPIPL